MTAAPHPSSQSRLAADVFEFNGPPKIRIVPARYPYGKPALRWVIYRNGVRMWTKTRLDNAIVYAKGLR